MPEAGNDRLDELAGPSRFRGGAAVPGWTLWRPDTRTEHEAESTAHTECRETTESIWDAYAHSTVALAALKELDVEGSEHLGAVSVDPSASAVGGARPRHRRQPDSNSRDKEHVR